MQPTEAIERFFSDYFEHWKILLPPESVKERTSGHIFEHGWHIGYLWGIEDGEEYLEFLAQHRMTDDPTAIFESLRPGESRSYPHPPALIATGLTQQTRRLRKRREGTLSTTGVSMRSCGSGDFSLRPEGILERMRSMSTFAQAARSMNPSRSSWSRITLADRLSPTRGR